MIHPTAIVSSEVEIGGDVSIGPYAVIKGQVQVGNGTRIESHVCIGMGVGSIAIGENNHFFPGSIIGCSPQHLGYQNEHTCLVIGSGNTFRENSTVHIGTTYSQRVTKIGDNNLLMAYVHVGHDCQLGNKIVISNSSNLGGHVEVGDQAVLAGNVQCAPFIKLGQLCYLTGGSIVNKDILPFSIADGRFAIMRAANNVGLERANFPKEEVQSIRRAIRYLIKGTRTTQEAIEEIHKHCPSSRAINDIVNFTKSSHKGLAK